MKTTAFRLCHRSWFREAFNITSKEGSSWDVALNQAAVEALYSAAYIEDYLDCVENLPDDVQRNLSQLRELDVKYQGMKFLLCELYFRGSVAVRSWLG